MFLLMVHGLLFNVSVVFRCVVMVVFVVVLGMR